MARKLAIILHRFWMDDTEFVAVVEHVARATAEPETSHNYAVGAVIDTGRSS